MVAARETAEAVARRSYGRLVAWLSAQFGDIALAEDAVGDALAAALKAWPKSGVPANPEGWLATAAKRGILKQRERESRFRAALPFLQQMSEERAAPEDDDFPDARLKLMFTCAHPAIDHALHTPLILQSVLGFTADEIGSAFLVSPSAMGQRLARVKRKIAAAGIDFRVPEAEELPQRLGAVLDAIYAAFGLSWINPACSEMRDLSEEAMWLGNLVAVCLPGRAEVLGLNALMLFSHSRRNARRNSDNEYVPLSEQDVSLWDGEMMKSAQILLVNAARIKIVGRYQIEAAIQAVHSARAYSGETNWRELQRLYDLLWHLHPTLSVFVGRAAAHGEAQGAEHALALLGELPAETANSYQPYWALKGELLMRAGQCGPAEIAFNRAVGLADDDAVRRFLQTRLEHI